VQTAKYIGKQAKKGKIHARFEIAFGPTPSVFSWTAEQLAKNIEVMRQNEQPEEYVKIFEEALKDLEA